MIVYIAKFIISKSYLCMEIYNSLSKNFITFKYSIFCTSLKMVATKKLHFSITRSLLLIVCKIMSIQLAKLLKHCTNRELIFDFDLCRLSESKERKRKQYFMLGYREILLFYYRLLTLFIWIHLNRKRIILTVLDTWHFKSIRDFHQLISAKSNALISRGDYVCCPFEISVRTTKDN